MGIVIYLATLQGVFQFFGAAIRENDCLYHTVVENVCYAKFFATNDIILRCLWHVVTPTISEPSLPTISSLLYTLEYK
ncbi:MAG: hypothetical protein FD167_2610 [bacterium]|nr:MAG: hypothetical protein FD167_2610 [bacterium]